MKWVYDTLAELKGDYGAARGASMAQRHWPTGEIAPVTVLVRRAPGAKASSAPAGPNLENWAELSARLTSAVETLDSVSNVRSLTQPVGTGSSVAKVPLNVIRQGLLRASAGEYISPDGSAMRLDVVLDKPSLSLEAMDAAAGIRRTVRDSLPEGFEAHFLGATAEMIDVRQVTQRDFHRVAVIVLAVIFVIVLVLLRDALLTAFLVLSTVLSYLATLGISYWVFAGLFGAAGLDWKVEVFLFVVMVAVGVDYNIFLTARIKQESRSHNLVEATRRAVVHTGPVISSCGIIMAATLGSLMTGDLSLLVQLGFAFALGMIIDTFIVRPLLVPAFVVLTGRRRHPAPA